METKYPGGINKLIKEIAEALSKKGHELIVIQPNPYNLPNEEVYKKFRIIRINSWFRDFYGLNLNAYFYIKNFLKEYKVDLVHIHGYQTFFSLIIINTIKKFNKDIPIVFSPHMDIYRSTFAGKYFWNIYNFFGKKIFYNADFIISDSNFEARYVINNYGENDKMSIIPLGVNVISKKKLKRNKKLHLLYSGYLVERKGVNYILYSLNTLINELNFKNVKLTIIGEGPEKSKLLKLSKNLKVDNHVMWKSFLTREEFIKEIINSNIFLLLSNSEAYGITVAEALALGTPCIVTKITALKEFLNEPGCFGVDYPPDPKEVANLIMKMYGSNLEVGPFSQKIRTWDKVAEDYEKAYYNLIG